MTVNELAVARYRLEELRTEIIRRPVEMPTAERHAEQMDDAAAQQAALRVAGDRTREAKQLQQINRALDAIREGDYGTCQDCENEIPAKRMKAVPWATRCIPCQERQEEHEKEREREQNMLGNQITGSGWERNR